MKLIRRFLRLRRVDHFILIKSAFLLWTVRLGLWLLPFQILRASLSRLMQIASKLPRNNPPSLERIIWAITVASKGVPQATCLTQALAAQVLLAQYGYQTRLRIGVTKATNGHLEGHAWLENEGKIIIGNLKNLSRYTLLPPLEG